MKKTALLLTIVCFFSCSKENNQRENTDTNTYCKSYVDDLVWPVGSGTHYITNTTLTYYASNRLSQLESVGTNNINKAVYEYPSESIYRLKSYHNGELGQHEAYFINSSKLIDSSVGMVTNNELDTVLFYKYIYDASNRIIKVLRTYKENNQILDAPPYSYEYDTRSNQTKAALPGAIYENTYYVDLKNPSPIPFPFQHVSPYLIKEQALHLVDTTMNFRHTYSFDSQGRIATDTTFASPSEIYNLRTYKY